MFKKGLTVTLASAILLMPTSAFALTKDETVYCKLDNNGLCKKTTVTDHYINNENLNQFTFITNLNNLSNLNGDEKLKENDKEITVKANGNDIYVEGNQTKELPVKLDITYSLNGKTYKPSKMKGKKGHVVVTVKYTNLDKHGNLYTPFVVTLGTELSTKNNSNVTVTNGKVLSTGANDIVAAVAAPGLYESLNLPDLKKLDTITIEYDTKSYDETSLYSVITPKLLDSSDLNMFGKLDGIYQSVGTLESSMNQILSGSNEFTSKFGEYSSKMNEVEAYSKILSEKYEQVDEGINQINDGLEKLDQMRTSIDAMTEGFAKIAAGTQALSDNTALLDQELAGTLTLMTTHLQTLGKIAAETTDENTKAQLYAEIQSLKTQLENGKLEALKSSIDQINQNLQYLNSNVQLFKASTKQLTTSINMLYLGTSKLSNGSKEYKAGINEYALNITKINTATKQLEAGNLTLNAGLNRFNNEGIKKISDIINNKVKITQYKVQELIKLSNEYKSYTESNVDGTVKFILVTNKK